MCGHKAGSAMWGWQTFLVLFMFIAAFIVCVVCCCNCIRRRRTQPNVERAQEDPSVSTIAHIIQTTRFNPNSPHAFKPPEYVKDPPKYEAVISPQSQSNTSLVENSDDVPPKRDRLPTYEESMRMGVAPELLVEGSSFSRVDERGRVPGDGSRENPGSRDVIAGSREITAGSREISGLNESREIGAFSNSGQQAINAYPNEVENLQSLSVEALVHRFPSCSSSNVLDSILPNSSHEQLIIESETQTVNDVIRRESQNINSCHDNRNSLCSNTEISDRTETMSSGENNNTCINVKSVQNSGKKGKSMMKRRKKTVSETSHMGLLSDSRDEDRAFCGRLEDDGQPMNLGNAFENPGFSEN